jgi:hypothetical protein
LGPATNHVASIVGNLPPGTDSCSVAELVERFGSGSEERETEIDELLQLIEAAKIAGVRRLVEMEKRTDLSAERLASVRRSYKMMMREFLRDIKLFEAKQARRNPTAPA